MTDTQFDVLAIGNAIVDILVYTDDRFLNTHGLIKGTMGLVDWDASRALYDKVGPALERSGGSAANTIAGVASLGGRGAFIGKVCDDQLGSVFSHDMRAIGVFRDRTNDRRCGDGHQHCSGDPRRGADHADLPWRLR